MKILVIDDEKPTLAIFKLFLTAYGYEVLIAEDGKKGVELFEQEHPQIVFTDLKMPKMDGIEVLKKVRSFECCHQPYDSDKYKNSYKHSQTEVIIITGHGDMEKAIEALDLDASDFINKPVEKRALESALKRAELRIRNRTSKSSELIFNRVSKSTISIKISGKLTASPSKNILKRDGQHLPNLNLPDFNGVNLLEVNFGTDFSITKDGIGWLIYFMEWIRDQGIKITMRGLSYNYIKFFKMAGLHEIANIVEAKYDE